MYTFEYSYALSEDEVKNIVEMANVDGEIIMGDHEENCYEPLIRTEGAKAMEETYGDEDYTTVHGLCWCGQHEVAMQLKGTLREVRSAAMA